jgi:hypothetical protein
MLTLASASGPLAGIRAFAIEGRLQTDSGPSPSMGQQRQPTLSRRTRY